MKKLLMIAVLCTISLAASAQFTNSKKSTKSSSSSSFLDYGEWNKAYIQYNSTKLNSEKNENTEYNYTLSGLAIGYSKGISIMQSTPLFIEPGISLNYNWGTENGSHDEKIKITSLRIPVNLVYKWDVSPSMSILPYIGLYAKYNISAKLKSGDDTFDDRDIEEADMFDKDDMGDDEHCLKHLLLGWQIGADLLISHDFFVGISYGKDMSTAIKNDKYKFSAVSITAGIIF